jgi:3-phytase
MSRFRASLLAGSVVWLAACGGSNGEMAPRAAVTAAGATVAVEHDADDPAFWRHPADPALSLILGTDKRDADGALVVFSLDGSLRQRIGGLARPNNVDVEYDVTLGAWRGDVAVLTERRADRLRLFGIPADGSALVDLAPAGLPVLAGPMGIGLYRRPADGALFAIVAPGSGPLQGYLAQYRIDADAAGAPRATLVRRFGSFSGRGEMEAVAVDDELGFVYVADEHCCLRKHAADPDAPGADAELARFGESGYRGDREGIAIVSTSLGRGFLLSADQIGGGSTLQVYRREGDAGAPHRHAPIGSVIIDADATDGIEASAGALPGYAGGLLLAMSSRERRFQLYRLDEVLAVALAARSAASFSPILSSSPRGAGS